MAGALPPFVLGYDGSFVGFLCAAAEAINTARTGLPAPTIRGFTSPGELFDDSIRVRSDKERAKRLWCRLAHRAGQEALHHCLEALCSDHEGKENAIAYAMGRMSLEGKSALCDLDDLRMSIVDKAATRARNQAHLITGLLRFSELADGSWYALIAPECDILPLIARHFASRFSAMVFTIYDKKHGTAIFHNPGQGYAIATDLILDSGGNIPLSERERLIRDEWTEYFESVAIAPRKNLRLQANHMPKKYWPFIAQQHLF